ncbi:hypothetical protein [Paraburkholderia acidiphila]|uniref:Uncharacterized protein n=1 Tax=Paraburkholderia acidiphila TaxID=2571747 RepID=A0A7Z2G8J6_9BURK|nr:hypothetical protein [Paraburkholderia acidiphila]QGZ57178.1 hypothetical protein FAZ97_19825 [Paraburkholderia acidiphila]
MPALQPIRVDAALMRYLLRSESNAALIAGEAHAHEVMTLLATARRHGQYEVDLGITDDDRLVLRRASATPWTVSEPRTHPQRAAKPRGGRL